MYEYTTILDLFWLSKTSYISLLAEFNYGLFI